MNRKKLFFAGAIGNTLETFEAIIYLFLQPFITLTFFPPTIKENKVLFFLTVIIPFLARPLGGLFFGFIGDLYGRKTVLESSMILSGVSCSLIAILPAYQDIGLFSFILLLLLRFIFGFAMSGEYNNSFLYLAEHAEPRSRGFIVSWAAFGVSFGIFLAASFVFVLTHLIENQVLMPWTFRLLFLFSAFSFYIGYVVRKDLSETIEFFISHPSLQKKKAKTIYITVKNDLKASLLPCLKIILLSGLGTHLTFALLLYAPFHLANSNTTVLSFKNTILLIILSSCVTAALIPLIGKISDFIGRKFLLLLSLTMTTVLYLLFFFYLASDGSYQELITFYLVLALFNAIYFCIAPAEIIDILPSKMRSTVNGLLYSIPAAMCGALSLPYFQIQLQAHRNSPLIILIITLPLFLCFWNDKKKLFQTCPQYIYLLEKAKVR